MFDWQDEKVYLAGSEDCGTQILRLNESSAIKGIAGKCRPRQSSDEEGIFDGWAPRKNHTSPRLADTEPSPNKAEWKNEAGEHGHAKPKTPGPARDVSGWGGSDFS